MICLELVAVLLFCSWWWELVFTNSADKVKHWDPVGNEKPPPETLQRFAHILWCRRVFYSIPAFKTWLKSNFVFKLSRHFKLAKPLYLSTFVPPVKWLNLALPCICNFLLTITRLQKVDGPYATSGKSVTSFKPERVIMVITSSLVLHVTYTPGFHLAILFLSAIIFHWGGRIWVPFMKTIFVLM